VTYKGNAPALTDVLANHVPAMFSLLSDARPQAESGAIRLLGVASAKRTPQAPDLPTIAEPGFPGFSASSWHGLMAPAGTPQVIIQKIAAEIVRLEKDPQFAARLTTLGVDPLVSSPEEFAAMIAEDTDLWRDAIKIANINTK